MIATRSGWIAGIALSLVVGGRLNAQEKEKEKKESGPLLVAFGASVGACLFEAHDKIAACELASKDAAHIEQLQIKLSISVNILKVLIENLDRAREDKALAGDDQRFVERSIQVSKLVQEEAIALKKFLTSKDAKDNERFQEVKKKADRELKILLGVKK